MNKGNSAAILVLGVLVILGIAFALGFYGTRGYSYHGWGMMGPWMWGGMFLMWLVPLGIVVLAVLGVVWLVQTLSGRDRPTLESRSCPSCGKLVQEGWKNCPYCGTQL